MSLYFEDVNDKEKEKKKGKEGKFKGGRYLNLVFFNCFGLDTIS